MSRISLELLSEEHPIEALIAPSGLHLLRVVDLSRTLHKELLGALVERWWPTTDTFHFGWGEMTMTRADFFCYFRDSVRVPPFGGSR